jgi:hypothetical protein
MSHYADSATYRKLAPHSYVKTKTNFDNPNHITSIQVFTVQAYQTSQYVVRRGGIFLGKWRSSFAGNSNPISLRSEHPI